MNSIKLKPITFGLQTEVISNRANGLGFPLVEVKLDPGETYQFGSGHIVQMDKNIELNVQSIPQGFLAKIWHFIRRMFTGEKLFFSTLKAADKAGTALISPSRIGDVIKVDLKALDGSLICRTGAYFCSEPSVSVQPTTLKNLKSGLLGGQGLVMQKITGNTEMFLEGTGQVLKHTLKDGETLQVGDGCLLAMTPDVKYNVKTLKGGVKNWLFGNQGVFMMELSGPGTVYVQSGQPRTTGASSASNSLVDGLADGIITLTD